MSLYQLHYRVGNTRVTAGIVIQDGYVILAAPIVGFMKRSKWDLEKVLRYCKKKNYKVLALSKTGYTVICP